MSEPLRAISLFSGAGGMDVGFENAGIKVVFANELVSDAAETYKVNHPDCIMVNDDINNVIDSLDKYEGIDLVFGGPPCQGFSVAGKMDPDDDRSKLIFTFLDVVERVKPRAFVMENVKALGELSKWKDVRERYLKKASDLGYDAQCIITGGLFTSIYLSDEIFDYFSCFTVSKLPYCFCFYLANPFSCNAKFPSQFLKCPLFAIHEAKSVFYYFRFTFF